MSLLRSQSSPARPPRQRRPGSLLVNLAASPFVNRRPVQRFTIMAWVLGTLLAGLNIWLWVEYRHDSTAMRTRLAETRSQIEATSKSVVEMGRELESLDLGAQNEQVDFLNLRIAERTFPWSLLFENIAAVLPAGVRLISLTPVTTDASQRGRDQKESQRTPGEELVGLRIRGSAKSDQDLYDLIDAFFAAPAFERPQLHQENLADGEVQFTVDVDYKPRLGPPPATPPVGRPSAVPAVGPPSAVPVVGPPQPSHRPAAAPNEETGESGEGVQG